ncbi:MULTISPECIES: transketolase [unclassified Sulfitobacter]|uniref:transketolase n=1 Tax=unclassified Sulfitobacter TaxID=196795 RepID=UPI0007C25AFB|nr:MULTISPECIES: transketolase [unclassified Sulfitobacter]KZY03554.1 transketolase [Sulfitobacter sp. HI0023]KZY24621.1 transketolase [Sulfitobacter sp. HI0040]KZZ67173.1 transketolase [Sulfitobacter sp. HI0129]
MTKRGNVSLSVLEDRAKFIRKETVRLSRIAGAGHYSSTFSCAELLAALYYDQMSIEPSEPDWPDRDRFVMSKGHAAIGLYPVLADLGYFDPSELDTYTRLGSPYGDHPDMKKVRGLDFSSGSLGHGLSVGLGLALAARISGRDYRTYVLLGDGELSEGQIWEAANAAGHFKLRNLVAIVDRNGLSIDGHTEEVMSVEPLEARFAAFGWDTQRIDGHEFAAIRGAFDTLKTGGQGKPQVIIADTIKGRGVERMEMSLDWHVGNLVGEDYDAVMAELDEGLKPFVAEDAT